MNKIFYAPVSSMFDSLVSERELEDDNYIYHSCPVWKHKSNRTFIAIAPFDFEINFDLEQHKVLYDELGGYLPNPLIYEDYDLNSKHAVLQIKFPIYYFWTHNEVSNMWFEQLDYPMTSLNNNFVTIGGWWNLVEHSRAISHAIKVVDKTKPVIIKKGEPLYRIRFYPENLNDGIKLIKSDVLPERVQKQRDINLLDRPGLNRKLFTKKESKCPFKQYLNL